MRPVIGAIAAVLTLCSCSYRIASPPALGEPLAIIIEENKSRLVRSQAPLQQEVGRVLHNRLGWDISPLADATLSLRIEREEIGIAARATDNSPSRYVYTIRATAIMYSPSREPATMTRRFSGTGYANGRSDEDLGLQEAANSMATAIADWLEHSTDDWPIVELEPLPTPAAE